MMRLPQFLAVALLVVWLGVQVTLTFYVAPSLFGNESGLVPDSSAAGEIIAPLLHKMDVTGWIVLPAVVVLHGWMWARLRPRGARLLLVSTLLLFAAWLSGLYAGLSLSPELHSIRGSLKEKFGGYHLAPSTNPERERFAKLHGLSMILVLTNMGLGLGSLFCVLQLGSKGPAPATAEREATVAG